LRERDVHREDEKLETRGNNKASQRQQEKKPLLHYTQKNTVVIATYVAVGFQSTTRRTRTRRENPWKYPHG
jgi:hypothetical protein